MNDEFLENYQEDTGINPPNERAKGWLLTQERALEIYEFIQNSLDVTQWDLPIKSENFKKMSFADFITKAKPRIIYKPEIANFNPSIVADDCINILETMPMTFETIKNRMEDVFRSLLVVNEDMDSFIKDMEFDKTELNTQIRELEKENQILRDELELTKIELQKKETGIKPLTDIIQIRVKEIIKLYQDFKQCIGKEEEMIKFLPIFEKEVESTIKLIQLKETQVLNSELNEYLTKKENEIKQRQETSEPLPPEEEFPDDDAYFEPESDEEEDQDDPRTPLVKKRGYSIEKFEEAQKNFKRDISWSDEEYDRNMVTYIHMTEKGIKWKPPKKKK